MSSLKTSLISTACGWLLACCIYIVHDTLWPQPPDDALDWIVTDLVILVCAAPLAIVLWLLLWSACSLLSRSGAFWQVSLWIVCGGVVGFGLVYLSSPLFKGSRPISPLNYGSWAGALAFGMAFFLRYRHAKSPNQAIQRTAGRPYA